MRTATTVCVCLMLASGCAMSADGKGPEGDPLLGGKADTVDGTIEHSSAIQEIGEIGVSFTEEIRGHAWTFQLGMSERVAIHTDFFSGEEGREAVDTVLYLFRKSDEGWGHYIRRNDDANRDTLWSRIEDDLEPGDYRILVKPFADSVQGDFAVNLRCGDGFCNWFDPADQPEPTDPGAGEPDPVGTGSVSVRVPLLDENDEEPMSRFNDALEAAGLPGFPELLTAASEDGAWSAELDALAEQAAREDVLEVTGGELLRFSDPATLVPEGFCYRGDGTAVPDFLAGLSDSVLSDMFSVWGWRAGDKSAYDEWREPTADSDIYDAWQAFDPSGTDVLVVYSVDDEGLENTALIPACR